MTDNAAVTLAAASFRRLHPRAYMSRLVEQGLRPDGRRAMETRPVKIVKSTIKAADGSALVTVGRTSVLCGIQCFGEVGLIEQQELEQKGRIQIQVSLTGLCGGDKYQVKYPQGASNPPISNEAFILVEYLTRLINDLVSLKDLCFEQGVYVLQCDLICLDDDGNLMDASVLALVGALKDLTLPAMLVLENSTCIRQDNVTKRKKLNIKFTPIPLSFGIFESILLPDPTSDEELVMDGIISVLMNFENGDCSFWKPGGPSLTMEAIKLCTQACKSRKIEY